MQIFAKLTKVDENTGIVYGRATEEVPDRSGEIFDYASSKPYFEKWSTEVSKATDGKSVGNVRAMHGKVAAGKLTQIDFVDAEKAIDVCAKIVDAAERQKCVEGVYTGFSIGGNYTKSWQDKGLRRYTAEPTEISLVDLPCVPTAHFTVVKADGSEELHKFVKIAEREDVKPKEGEHKYGDVKFADEKNKKYPIDTAAHIRAAWNYIHKPKNAAEYDAADVAKIKAKIVAAWKDKIDSKGPPSAAKKYSASQLEKNADAERLAQCAQALLGEPVIEKGLFNVAQFAQVMMQLCAILDCAEYEADAEGDDSPVPAQIQAALKPIAEAFLAMAEEEIHEAVPQETTVKTVDPTELEKLGAKHSAETKSHIEALKKAHAEMGKHLDAMDGKEGEEDGKDDDEEAEKLAKVTAERDDLMKRLAEVGELLPKILAMPQPVKGVVRAVSKAATPGSEETIEVLKKDGSPDYQATAMNLMKQAYKQPVAFTR